MTTVPRWSRQKDETLAVDEFMADHPQTPLPPVEPTWEMEPRLFDESLAPAERETPKRRWEPALEPQYDHEAATKKARAEERRAQADHINTAPLRALRYLLQNPRKHTFDELGLYLKLTNEYLREVTCHLEGTGMIDVDETSVWPNARWLEKMGAVSSYQPPTAVDDDDQ